MWPQILTLLALPITLSSAKKNCPLYGPQFPKTRNLLQQPGLQSAAKILDDVFTQYIDHSNTTGSEAFSYSVEVFSGNDDAPLLWSHHWTATNLKYFNSTGVIHVDENTVYRIGSITKIFTVFAFLATVGDGIWNDPVTKYLPEVAELAAARKDREEDPIFEVDWDEITVGSLASQTSGLMRDCE